MTHIPLRRLKKRCNVRLWYKDLIKYLPRQQLIAQCLFNLQEKYDYGGIPEEEWKVIENHFDEYLD